MEPKPPITYQQWSRNLADHFFNSENHGRTVFFSVDARILSDMTGLSEEDAVDSLVEAVKDTITTDWRVRRVSNLTWLWEKSDRAEPPPAVAFLAFIVLAATRMGENRNLAANNFYVPLRQMLDASDTGVGAPGDFTEHVEHLWDSVRRWLRDDLQGRHGLLPDRPESHFRYIIEALQFAVIRASHFRKLDDFFRRIGLEPGEEVVGRDLVLHLKAFLRTRHENWAMRLLHFCDEYETIAATMIVEEARKWDGMPRDARTGRAIGHIRLGFESTRNPRLFLLAEWDSRLPTSLEVSGPDDTRLPLSAIHEDGSTRGWFEPIPLDLGLDIPRLLDEGGEIKGSTNSFDFAEARVYAFSFDEVASCWSSVGSMSTEVLHHILVPTDSAVEVLRFFEETSAIKPSMHTQYPADWPEGWVLLRGIRLDVRPSVKVPDMLGGLIPSGAGPRLRTEGGLRVGAVERCYLTGGEPMLMTNSLAGDEPVVITRVDPVSGRTIGEACLVDVSEHDSGEIPLWNIDLMFVEGLYSVRHGASQIRLQFVDSLSSTGGPGMSSVTTRLSATSEATGTCVVGAPQKDEPVMVPAPSGQPGTNSKVVIVIGARSGEFVEVRLPSIGHLSNLSWTDIDAWCGFEPQFCVDFSRGGRITPLTHTPTPPTPSVVSSREWRVAVLSGRTDSLEDAAMRDTWSRYRELAESSRA